MRIIAEINAETASTTVLEDVTNENIVQTMTTFFNKVGIHFAEELAPSRSNALLNNGTLHMFDHAKRIDYRFRLESV